MSRRKKIYGSLQLTVSIKADGSVESIDVAREMGIPTLLTIHDYWSICARVQLIRPDGVAEIRCGEAVFQVTAGVFLADCA